MHSDGQTEVVDNYGSLCENNEACSNRIPQIGNWCLLVIDRCLLASKGYQYNAKLRSAEILYNSDGGA